MKGKINKKVDIANEGINKKNTKTKLCLFKQILI